MLVLTEPTNASEQELDIERRRALRVMQQRPIKLYEPTSGKYFGGQTHDVSATGLRIELPVSAAVRPNKLITVHVGVSSSGESLANRRQMIPAKVVWVDRSRELGGKLTAGIEFLANISAHLEAA